MAPLLTEEESALDPYIILGVVVGSSEKEITKAYRKASLKWHPDKNQSAEAPAKFREIQLSLEILSDPAKKAYIENKLESDRRRKEKYAQSDKKRKAMIDALEKREEEAQLAKVEAQRRRKEEAKEEEIMDAGKRMLAEAQKRAGAAASASVRAGQSSNEAGFSNSTTETESTPNGAGPSRSTRPQSQQPPISSIDLTLILQFPPTPSSSSTSTDLQNRLTSSYGPINHVFLKDPVAPAGTGKKKSKGKGRKAIIEFKEGNWGGCWACWRDVLAGQGEWQGVKIKFAAGETPEWVAWSETHRPQAQPQAQAQAFDPEPRDTIPKDPSATQGPPVTALPTFSSAPNFGQSTMSDLLASHNQSRAQSRADEVERKKRESEFESMTILKMRQMERERLAEEIRREEEGLV